MRTYASVLIKTVRPLTSIDKRFHRVSAFRPRHLRSDKSFFRVQLLPLLFLQFRLCCLPEPCKKAARGWVERLGFGSANMDVDQFNAYLRKSRADFEDFAREMGLKKQ